MDQHVFLEYELEYKIGKTIRLLVPLCHKFVVHWQQGQRGKRREMVRAIATRTDVMEFGT